MSQTTPTSGSTIVTLADPNNPSSVGTYQFQMADCTSCTKNQATLTTILSVMQQQAATLKEQQSTIASLISMMSNGATPATVAFRTSGDNTRTPVVKINRLPSSQGTGHSTLSATPTQGSTRKRPIAEAYDDITNGIDSDTVTKIWIRGSLHEKCPCPLKECAHRKFAAADMYHLRRHFTQIHRLTHPNPFFVFQCPVEECGAEFEDSMREMRKHLIKDHADQFPTTPGKNSADKSPTKPGESPLNGSMQVAEEEEQEEVEEAEDGEEETVSEA